MSVSYRQRKLIPGRHVSPVDGGGTILRMNRADERDLSRVGLEKGAVFA